VLQAPGGKQSFSFMNNDFETDFENANRTKNGQKITSAVDVGRTRESSGKSIDPARLKQMSLPDLRILCRSNNVQPAGSKETLVDRLSEMIKAGAVISEKISNEPEKPRGRNDCNVSLSMNQQPLQNSDLNNNYARSASQNVGNFLTGRNSSRVLAPPGGASSGLW
jgi:hypothetical protein